MESSEIKEAEANFFGQAGIWLGLRQIALEDGAFELKVKVFRCNIIFFGQPKLKHLCENYQIGKLGLFYPISILESKE